MMLINPHPPPGWFSPRPPPPIAAFPPPPPPPPMCTLDPTSLLCKELHQVLTMRKTYHM